MLALAYRHTINCTILNNYGCQTLINNYLKHKKLIHSENIIWNYIHFVVITNTKSTIIVFKRLQEEF